MHNPLVSILILNFNGRHHLRECLDSVLAQSYSNFEVVLVDNASKDGSADYVASEYPSVKLVRSQSNLGFAGGNNFGRRHCSGEYVFFLNNDTRVDKDAVAALIRAREEHPDYSVFGSLLLDYSDPSKVDSAGDTFYWMGNTFGFEGYPAAMFNQPRPIAWPRGAAAMYPKDLLDRIGWFDEDFFLNFEDADLAFRAWHTGAQALLAPASLVYHKGSAALGGKQSALSVFYASRNYHLVMLKTFPAALLIRFLPGLLFSKAGQAYGAHRIGRLLACLRGNLSSLRLLPRIMAKRRRIMKDSRLPLNTFMQLFRKNMFSEQRSFRQGFHDVPVE